MNNLKQEKGSITLFVLIAMLFFVMFLVGMYMLSANSESSQIAETTKIKEIYEQGVNNIDDVYNTLIVKNQNVNAPVYKGTGLTPVTINADGTTTNANTSTPNWYSYDGTVNHWANAKTKDGSMWVWIPRFAYKITYTDASDKSSGGTIDVVFLKDTTNNDFNGNDVTLASYVDEKGVTGAYIVHPAFQDGSSTGYINGEWDKEIPGFWIAKFEAGYVGTAGDASSAIDSNVKYSTIYSYIYYSESGDKNADLASNYYGPRTIETKIKYPTFQANRPSMNYIGISDAYDLCRSLQNASSVFGLNNIDSHMTKNSEWGAIAYLTQSKYGRNGTKLTVNNISLDGENTVYAVTGYAGESIGATGIITTLSTINNGNQEGSWTTTQGQTASSTGNLYGIYDLNGGLFEWTAGYIATEGNYETYGGSLIGESSKYKTKYAGTSATNTENYSQSTNTTRLGEAIWETSSSGTGSTSWNGMYSIFLRMYLPFAIRGGLWNDSSHSGIFAFGTHSGWCHCGVGFRAVLVAE